MGAKHAGVHVRCNDSARILAVLEKEFGREIGPEKEDLAAMEMIAAVAKKNINSIADSGEKSQKEAMLSRLMLQTQQEMREGEPAVVVVREHFVSIYWYDHIRVENLCPQTSKYSALCGVPAMGVGVYDDTNFSIYAICNANMPNMQSVLGEYLFDYEDISPVEAGRVCEIMDAPFMQNGLHKALACDEGEAMAATFEQETGLPILMDEGRCRACGMEELCHWSSAVVFDGRTGKMKEWKVVKQDV